MGNYTTGKSTVALNDDGEIDMERFAKVVFMASKVLADKDNLTISGVAGDEIQNGTAEVAANCGQTIVDLGAKVTAQIVAASSGATAPADLDNIVVLSHTLVPGDVSTNDVDKLKVGANQTVKDFLDRFSRKVYQHNNYGLHLDGSENPVQNAKLQLNGHDRFSERDGHYFNYVQPNQHFSNTPADGINVYSLLLTLREHQPSGTCNMSRIDNATLSLKLGERNGDSARNFADDYLVDDTVCSIYTVNYNVLRVMSGMGGVAYSN